MSMLPVPKTVREIIDQHLDSYFCVPADGLGEIVREYLSDEGIDGLCAEECGCDGSMPCGGDAGNEGWMLCRPARHIKPDSEDCDREDCETSFECKTDSGGCYRPLEETP